MTNELRIEAVLAESSPRAAAWREVFGELRAPITSPIPRLVNVVGVGDVDCFFVEVEQLSEEQRERLVAFIVRRFGTPAEDARRDLEERGVFPLLAEDVYSVTDLRLFV